MMGAKYLLNLAQTEQKAMSLGEIFEVECRKEGDPGPRRSWGDEKNHRESRNQGNAVSGKPRRMFQGGGQEESYGSYRAFLETKPYIVDLGSSRIAYSAYEPEFQPTLMR